MTVRNRLGINLLVYVLLAFGLGILLLGQSDYLAREVDTMRQTYSIVRSVFDLTTLSNDYLVQPGERPVTQWETEHDHLGKLLNQVVMAEIGELKTIGRLRKNHREIKLVFSRLAALRKKLQTHGAESGLSSQLEERLIGLLSLELQSMVADASQLHGTSQAQVADIQKRSEWTTVLLVVLTAMIMVGNYLVVYSAVIRPLTRLTSDTRIIGGGNLDYVVDVKSRDEFGDLAMAFNRMTLSLKKSYEDLTREIRERKLAEAEREKLITELEEKAEEMERFTYTVSHDLKSPLITIKTFTGFIEKDVAEGNIDEIKSYTERVVNAATSMGRLLDELLKLSRVGRIDNPPSLVSLRDLAQEAEELVSGRISERGVELQIASDFPTVYVDRPRLVEALQNLIENAVKFMGDQPRPKVEIGARYEDDEVIFYVGDNGLGIEPAHQEKVFGLFDQLDQSAEGVGAGLALVRRIVEVHGGRIWVESAGKGQGSTFCFTLPGKIPPDTQERHGDHNG